MKMKVLGYCLVICRVSSTDQFMSRGASKLLDNNTKVFIFYFYFNDDPRDPENRRQKRFSEQTSYNRLNGKAWLTAVVRLSANIPTLVSVDLIGEKNQAILEFHVVSIKCQYSHELYRSSVGGNIYFEIRSNLLTFIQTEITF